MTSISDTYPLQGSAKPHRARSDYAVGVICALAVEKAAFVAMLDEVHDTLPTSKDDGNSYTFGRIGDHNVVVACLPAGVTGNNAAATVAKDMLRSFPIKLGLMVGVGGGVWSRTVDIRLGDVVVSQPEGEHGGVVQWDFGKMESERFRRTGCLSRPPQPLLNAVQDLRIKHLTEGDRLADFLSEMIQNRPSMIPAFTYQGTEHDNLYRPSYQHTGGATCEQCNHQQRIERKHRTSTNPQIHYGNIASGNQVVKDSHFRDLVAAALGVICFDMEAAGLMDSFPCLVIRGVCDYADSHKNKRWQPYAAATAAAYTKDLLRVLKRQGVQELESSGVSPYTLQFSLEYVTRCRKFVDRPAEMTELEKVLLPRLAPNRRQQIQVLHGLGGVGKTQLAVEFARRHHSRFSAVFWLDGTSAEILKRSIAVCASRIPEGQISETSRNYASGGSIDVDRVVNEVMGWLARPANIAWLLIFDNVDREYNAQSDDPEAYDVRRYFSGADHGSILITTRLARLEQLGESQHLGSVNKAQAQAILENWYNDKQDTKEYTCRRLLELLGGLPLAIAQAGAYLRETGIGIDMYLKFYEQEWSKLMESGNLADDTLLQDYPNRSMWTTWAISYQAIRQRNESSANLLLLWSYLDNRDLWYGLFAVACQHNSTVAKLLSEWVGNIATDEFAFTWAMQLLRSYSLIEETQNEGSYATHPVVHRWAYHYHGKQFASKLEPLAVCIASFAQCGDLVDEYLMVDHRLFPHVQAASRWLEQRQTEWFGGNVMTYNEEEDKLKAKLALLRSVLYFRAFYKANGRLDQAEKMIKLALRRLVEALGPNHAVTVQALHSLGMVYEEQNKLEEAEKIYQWALQDDQNLLDSETSLTVLCSLSSLYTKEGRLDEAKKIYKQVLQNEGKRLGPNHLLTLSTVGNLANLYEAQGKLDKAGLMYKRVLRIMEGVLGPIHPLTLITVGNLGVLYFRQNKFEKAERMYELALQGYDKAFGETRARQYAPTLRTLRNLGVLCENQGNYTKAEALYSKALSGLQIVHGPSDSHCTELASRITNIRALIAHEQKSMDSFFEHDESTTRFNRKQRSCKL